jgi:hypothetical protein
MCLLHVKLIGNFIWIGKKILGSAFIFLDFHAASVGVVMYM